MSTRNALADDLEEALDLLARIDDYGLRLEMGANWCSRVDALMLKHPTVEDDEDAAAPSDSDEEDPT